MFTHKKAGVGLGRRIEWTTSLGCGFVVFGDDGKTVVEASNTSAEPRDPQPIPLTPIRLAHGAAGLAKAALGIDAASDETQASRLTICQTCDQAKQADGKVRTCKICRCLLMSKIKLADESCPLNRWPDVAARHHQKDETAGQ